MMVSGKGARRDVGAEPRRLDGRRFVGPLLLVATGVGMLWWTWRTWPDPLVDFGRELYVPWRLAEGDALFTDIAWFNGPLSQYVNALLFRVFGPGLSVLVWNNALVLAACVAMVHGLIARMSDRLTATVAGIVFLLVFAFGQYVGIANYNWITPYSHEATHGVALALAAVVAVERWHRTRSLVFVALGGLALGLCFLTKVETFLAGALGSAVLLAVAVRRRDARAPATFLLAALVPVAISVSLLGIAGTLGAWPSLLNTEVAQLPFYRGVTGLDRPAARAVEMVTWAGLWLLILLPLLAVARLAGRTRGLLVPLATAAVLLLALAALGERIVWANALRPLPIFAVTIAAWLSVGAWRGEETRTRIAGIAFAALGLALLAKMLLNVRVGHYGFVLAMPASMLVVTALVGWLPRWLDARGARGDVLRAGGLALLAIFALEHLSITGEWLDRKTEVVGSGRDAFRSDVRGAFVNQAITRVTASGVTSFAVLPEGVMLNYLARAANPTPYVNFMPPEELLFGDAAWTDAFRSSPPEMIVIVPKDTSEYGRGPFGVGYGRSLAAWVASEYTLGGVIRFDGIPYEIRILVRASPTG
jgi:hypothetical protein